jgi:acetyl esterase/lipase
MTALRPAPSIRYGDQPDNVANLHLPAGEGPFPVVVLVHGGFWRYGWDRTLMTSLAHDLVRRGIAAWNIEYRRVGQEGGGWPGTFLDVAAAVDHLEQLDAVDTSRVVTCGHSAGGHLALWLAGRRRVPAGAPGSDPVVRPRAAVAQGAVSDLATTYARDLGNGAAAALLGGGPDEFPERYRAADPAALAPLGVTQLLVHGARDDVVPVAQSRAHAAAGVGEVELVEFADADHFDVIEVDHPAWQAVVERLPALLSGTAVRR